MVLYTTYFAKLSKLPSDIVPISICLWPPKGVQIQSFPRLAPTQSILQEYKRQPDERRYTDRYCKEVLTQMNPPPGSGRTAQTVRRKGHRTRMLREVRQLLSQNHCCKMVRAGASRHQQHHGR